MAVPQFRKKHNRGPNPFLDNCECWYHIIVTNVNTKADASRHISRWLLPGERPDGGLLNCAAAWKNFADSWRQMFGALGRLTNRNERYTAGTGRKTRV
jgi:hypothetical protein